MSITIHKAVLLNFKWPYHANVIKTFDIVNKIIGANCLNILTIIAKNQKIPYTMNNNLLKKTKDKLKMKDIREIKDYQIIILGLIIALGAVFSTFIFSHAVVAYQKLNNQTLSVTGSASQDIKSDLAVWKAYYEVRSKDLKSGYAKINTDKKNVTDFLKASGIKEEDIKYTPISSYAVYKKLGNGYDSNDIDGYKLSQNVEVSSTDVEGLTKISQDVSKLVDKNVELTSNTVEYYVSNLDELKVKMLAQATKDAKQRAKSMVESTGGRIGAINSAKMGVFQIVAKDSTDVSDYGIYNTNAKDKKINAVVNVTFTIK